MCRIGYSPETVDTINQSYMTHSLMFKLQVAGQITVTCKNG